MRAEIDRDGIEQTRLLAPGYSCDGDSCPPLIRASENYSKNWDEDCKTFALRSRHKWASHGADAFSYLAMGLRPGQLAPRPVITIKPSTYSFRESNVGAKSSRP